MFRTIYEANSKWSNEHLRGSGGAGRARGQSTYVREYKHVSKSKRKADILSCVATVAEGEYGLNRKPPNVCTFFIIHRNRNLTAQESVKSHTSI